MMKKLSTAVGGAFLLTGASSPPLVPQVYFTGSPAVASSTLAAMCMDRKYSVLNSDEHQVLCGKEVEGLKGMLAQALLGNAYSTTPQQLVRFQMIPWGAGTRVQFSLWIETQMAMGQVQRAPLDSRKTVQGILSVLYAHGATEVPTSPPVAEAAPAGAEIDKSAVPNATAAGATGPLGIGFISSPAGVVVMNVAPGSAAKAAGLKAGQVVQSVNGIDMRGMPAEAVAAVIRAQDKQITFALAGGAKIKIASETDVAAVAPRADITQKVDAPAAQAAAPKVIDLGRVQLLPSKTQSGYCIKAPANYQGTGAGNSPAITSARPLCG